MPDTITNPVKAIRAFCLDCCGDNRSFVKDCPSAKCALYPFRLGKNPYLKRRELTDDEREELRNRLRKARETKSGHTPAV